MYWSLFAYGVIPVGAVLTLMLVSGMKWIVDLAAMFLSTPLRIKNVQLSLDLVMTGICSIMVLLSYSSVQRAESLVTASKQQTLWALRVNQDELVRNVAMQDRNLWLSVLGLTLWGVAWRLKTLFVSETIAVQARKGQHPVQYRLKFAAFALFCLALSDVPLCRLNYSYQLATQVSPKKANLLDFGKKNGCRDVMLASAAGECAKLCTEARSLATDRLWAVEFAREFHVFGKIAASFFDGFRGVEQGEKRIDELFAAKTCERVLNSVDTSNHMVNVACFIFTGISVIGCLIGIQNALSAPAKTRSISVGNTVTILGTENTRRSCGDQIGEKLVVQEQTTAYQVEGMSGSQSWLFEDDMELYVEAAPTPPMPSTRGPAVAVPTASSSSASSSSPAPPEETMPAASDPVTLPTQTAKKEDNVTD